MEEILEEDFESPYCSICTSCGIEGCCPPTMCTFEKGCKYPKTNLAELGFGYAMYKDLSRMIHNKCEKRNQDYDDFFMDEYKRIFDKNYEKVYKK